MRSKKILLAIGVAVIAVLGAGIPHASADSSVQAQVRIAAWPGQPGTYAVNGTCTAKGDGTQLRFDGYFLNVDGTSVGWRNNWQPKTQTDSTPLVAIDKVKPGSKIFVWAFCSWKSGLHSGSVSVVSSTIVA